MIHRGFVFEERPNEAIDVPIMFEERPRTDSIESASDCEDKKSQSSESRGSPLMPPNSAPLTQAAIRRMIKESVDAAIAAERARHVNARNEARGSGPVRGQDASPVVRECSFTGFMKCNLTVFTGKKVKFAAATLQGPALTWWNAKVATMGLETVND
ncbi:hypothetical protein Tco_1324366, partial [Tanacetum coccineum]